MVNIYLTQIDGSAVTFEYDFRFKRNLNLLFSPIFKGLSSVWGQILYGSFLHLSIVSVLLGLPWLMHSLYWGQTQAEVCPGSNPCFVLFLCGVEK